MTLNFEAFVKSGEKKEWGKFVFKENQTSLKKQFLKNPSRFIQYLKFLFHKFYLSLSEIDFLFLD